MSRRERAWPVDTARPHERISMHRENGGYASQGRCPERRRLTRRFLHDRYAYFKKLTYFSTECIYSPDGTSSFPLCPLI